MSVPREKINELLNKLNETDTNKVLKFAEALGKQKKKKLKPSDYRGIWKNEKLDVEKICKELRSEWDRNIL
jgi:hypothetical protein